MQQKRFADTLNLLQISRDLDTHRATTQISHPAVREPVDTLDRTTDAASLFEYDLGRRIHNTEPPPPGNTHLVSSATPAAAVEGGRPQIGGQGVDHRPAATGPVGGSGAGGVGMQARSLDTRAGVGVVPDVGTWPPDHLPPRLPIPDSVMGLGSPEYHTGTPIALTFTWSSMTADYAATALYGGVPIESTIGKPYEHVRVGKVHWTQLWNREHRKRWYLRSEVPGPNRGKTLFLPA